MSQFATILRVRTRGRGLYEFTGDLAEWVDAHQLETGLLTLFCRHTSASLLIQENAAPAVRDDLEAFFEVLAPEDKDRYSHDDEGPDDMPAHIRAALTQVSLSIPVVAGRPPTTGIDRLTLVNAARMWAGMSSGPSSSWA